MYKYNNKTQFLIRIKNKFSIESISSFFSKIPIVLGDVEYDYFNLENKENFLPSKFILNTSIDEIRSFFLVWSETRCEFSFYHNMQGSCSIFVQRFSNYFETDAGFYDSHMLKEPVDEKVLDIRRYLTILLDLCDDLIVEDIELREDNDKGPLSSPKPIPNTLAATFGVPLWDWLSDKRSYGDYFKIMINNMRKSDAIKIHDLQEDLLEKNISEKKYLTLFCSWHNYNLHLYFNFQSQLIIKPTDDIKYKMLDDVQITDAAFYTRFLLHISEGLNIKDLETYFNRLDYVYHLEDYQ